MSDVDIERIADLLDGRNELGPLARIAVALEQLVEQGKERNELLRESNARQIDSLTHAIKHDSAILRTLAREPAPETTTTPARCVRPGCDGWLLPAPHEVVDATGCTRACHKCGRLEP